MPKPRPPSPAPPAPEPGLCGTCRHVRRTHGARGNVFFRCARADEDPGFPRYPALPVRECAGFQAG